MSTIGSKLISELGMRGQLGMYFDYASYRTLRKIDSLAKLSDFVRTQGFECPSTPRDTAVVADALQDSERVVDNDLTAWSWVLLDPTGILGVLVFPVWLLGRLFDRD